MALVARILDHRRNIKIRKHLAYLRRMRDHRILDCKRTILRHNQLIVGLTVFTGIEDIASCHRVLRILHVPVLFLLTGKPDRVHRIQLTEDIHNR